MVDGFKAKIKLEFNKLKDNYAINFFRKFLAVFLLCFIFIGLFVAFFYFVSLDSLGKDYVDQLEIIIKNTFIGMFINLPRIFFYLYFMVFVVWNCFNILYFVRNRSKRKNDKVLTNQAKRYEIYAVLIIALHMNIHQLYILFILFILELVLVYLIVYNIILSDRIELQNIITSNGDTQSEKNQFIRLYSIIYLLIVGFAIAVLVDYTLLDLTSSQKQLLMNLCAEEKFYIIGKFMLHIKEICSNDAMHNTILQLASVFITFMGIVIGFRSQSLFSIDIHTIINWKCHPFMMLYYRVATIVIVILSFIVSGSRYMFTILYLDAYMIWIILYNLHLISLISLKPNLVNIFSERIMLDISGLESICKVVSDSEKINKQGLFYQEYINQYGKTICLPLSLLVHHIYVNKEECYQMVLATLSKIIKAVSTKLKDNILPLIFVLEKMFISLFNCLPKGYDNKREVDDLDIIFLSNVLSIIDKQFIDIDIGGLKANEIVIGFILFDLVTNIDEDKLLDVLKIYYENQVGENSSKKYEELWEMFYMLILLYKYDYYNLIYKILKQYQISMPDSDILVTKFISYAMVINTYYYFNKIPMYEDMTDNINRLHDFIEKKKMEEEQL